MRGDLADFERIDPDRETGLGERRGDRDVERREEEFANFLPDAYVFTDEHGIIRSVNQASLHLFGRQRWTLVGKPLHTLIELDQRREFRVALNTIQRSSAPSRWAVHVTVEDGAVGAEVTAAVSRDPVGTPRGIRWLIRRTDAEARAGEHPSPAPIVPATAVGAPPLTGDQARGSPWLLAQASALLSSSFDQEMTLRSVAQLVVPTLGDWCLIDVLTPSGSVRRVAAASASTEEMRLQRALLALPPHLDDEEDPIAGVLRGGEGDVLERCEGTSAPRTAPEGMAATSLTRLGGCAVATFPMRVRGRTVGALTLVMRRSGRPFSKAHLGVARDLAERAALAVDNARLYEDARMASEAKSAFLAMMSHELRTPLTAIIGYAELLGDGIFGTLDPDQLQPLDRIRESSQHLLVLVDEILTFARLDARRDTVVLESFDVVSVVEQALSMVRPLASGKDLELGAEFPAGRYPCVSDEGKLRQILVNLLVNAIKFTETGAVLVRVEEVDDMLELRVRDTGVGISEEVQARVFEPFWQVDPRLTRRHGGAGLGLSVVRELATLLGGGVEVRSTPGEGSCFTVRIARDLRALSPGDAADDS